MVVGGLQNTPPKNDQKKVDKNCKNYEKLRFGGPQTLGNEWGLSELFVTFLVSGAFGAALGAPRPLGSRPNLDV